MSRHNVNVISLTTCQRVSLQHVQKNVRILSRTALYVKKVFPSVPTRKKKKKKKEEKERRNGSFYKLVWILGRSNYISTLTGYPHARLSSTVSLYTVKIENSFRTPRKNRLRRWSTPALLTSYRTNVSSYSRSFNSLLFFFHCSFKRGNGRGRERETLAWTEVVKEYRCAKSRPRSFAVGALSFSDRAQGRVKGVPGPTQNQPLFFAPLVSTEIVWRFKLIFNVVFALRESCFEQAIVNVVSRRACFDTADKQNKATVRAHSRVVPENCFSKTTAYSDCERMSES